MLRFGPARLRFISGKRSSGKFFSLREALGIIDPVGLTALHALTAAI